MPRTAQKSSSPITQTALTGTVLHRGIIPSQTHELVPTKSVISSEATGAHPIENVIPNQASSAQPKNLP